MDQGLKGRLMKLRMAFEKYEDTLHFRNSQ